MAAPTYFGSNSAPADNGSVTDNTTSTLTPPGSMLAGDLVVIFAKAQSAVGDLSIANNGGQVWSNILDVENATDAAEYFISWCRFNGSWPNAPTVACASIPGTQPFTAVMHVFRPPTTSYNWFAQDAPDNTYYAAANTVTITGLTPTHPCGVVLGWWGSNDDNTWGTLTGVGWAVTGTAQYRNTGGGDQADSFAHFLYDAITAAPDTSKTQTANGPDAGCHSILSFYARLPQKKFAIIS